MSAQDLLPVLQMVLAICNIVIIGYGGYRFLNKPHDTLEEKHKALEKRVDQHDLEIREVKQSLYSGNDRFREQDNAIKVLIRSVLALVEFEMQYCLTEHKEMSKGLEKAKEALDEFISEK